jgi:hypothetical protein
MRARHGPHPSPGRARAESSFEIRFPDGRPSKFIYWDDLAGRRLLPDRVDLAMAERLAEIFARLPNVSCASPSQAEKINDTPSSGPAPGSS